MNISEAINLLVRQVPNPSAGLPDEVFYYVSRTTPLVNVDLLVKDENGRTLLSWRSDQYAGTGWHVPGGIVRFKETLETRIQHVALAELGAAVTFEPLPIAVNEMINPDRDIRGHFISFLYRCCLPSSFVPQNEGRTKHDPGYLMWHALCPDNLIRFHEVYRPYI